MSSPIQVGSVIPEHHLKEDQPDVAKPLVLKGKNILLGVPGAFTPTCHSQIPGYIKLYDEFQAKGVNGIYVFAVNDVFVMKAWKEDLAPNGTNIHFLADDTGAFSRSLGMIYEATPLLGRPCCQRCAIVTHDDKVITVAVEAAAKDLTITAAEVVLKGLPTVSA